MTAKQWLLMLLLCTFGHINGMSVNDTIPMVANCRMNVDNLGNCFIITPQNDIIKYNVNGQKTASNNVKLLGNIASIDVSNPFEIFVFYRDQNQLLILDNLLNIQTQIDLDPLGMMQIACLARSADNQIWLYDQSDFKLKKFSKSLEPMIESAALNTIQADIQLQVKQILDVNTNVLLANQNQVLSFDVYANYNKLVLIDTVAQFYWQNPCIVYQKHQKWQQYNTQNWQMQSIDLQLPNNTLSAYKTEENVYILTNDCLILRRLNKVINPAGK